MSGEDKHEPAQKREDALIVLQERMRAEKRKATSAAWENPFIDEQAEQDFLEIEAMRTNGVDEAIVRARETKLLGPHLEMARCRAERILSDPSQDPALQYRAKSVVHFISLVFADAQQQQIGQ